MDNYPEGQPISIRPMKTFPVVKDLVCDVSLELRGQQEDPRLQARSRARTGSSRRKKPTGCKSSASASSASCARTCATCCATTTSRPSSPGRGSSSAWPAWRCTRSTAGDRLPLLEGPAGPGLLQHHQVLHGSLPRAHQDHRQRHHPAERASGRSLLRPGAMGVAEDHGQGVAAGERRGTARQASRRKPDMWRKITLSWVRKFWFPSSAWEPTLRSSASG